MAKRDPTPGWGLVDTYGERLYIPRTWKRKKDAVDFRRDMIKHYPANHEWRRRLKVLYYAGDGVIREYEPYDPEDDLPDAGAGRAAAKDGEKVAS
jgi:hypothetical protein